MKSAVLLSFLTCFMRTDSVCGPRGYFPPSQQLWKSFQLPLILLDAGARCAGPFGADQEAESLNWTSHCALVINCADKLARQSLIQIWSFLHPKHQRGDDDVTVDMYSHHLAEPTFILMLNIFVQPCVT